MYVELSLILIKISRQLLVYRKWTTWYSVFPLHPRSKTSTPEKRGEKEGMGRKTGRKGKCEVLPNPFSLRLLCGGKGVLSVTGKEIGIMLPPELIRNWHFVTTLGAKALQCSAILILPAIEKWRNRIKLAPCYKFYTVVMTTSDWLFK